MTETLAADLKLIIFQLKGKEYAIPVSQVRSIEKVQHITRVPGIAPFVKGVINLRGVVTPIIDLRSRFDIDEVNYSDSTRVIIVALEDMEVGLIVDAANDVIDVATNSIEPPPEIVGMKEADYINGVVKIDKRLLILLDLSKVLNPEEVKTLNEFVG
ncbi:chemotaxis protein CheW [Bacillus sp. 31A1R]|uniref:Chemotaxis protein CheW n=1 Tax=Robertmurraya mangrovi TaxID=3098077 RepID=A0ABU5J207_9BACI|nr:chemotaxis protein CheW [Bacillus sp. 31A1R]MDZ5473460.1 chemotaxis protein CheW [Bacillus sp. 31A1R]